MPTLLEFQIFIVGVVPRLKTKIQISGLAIASAAGLLYYFAPPGNNAAILCGGAIGISLIIFSLSFNFINSFPVRDRAIFIVRMFIIFSFLCVVLLGMTIYFANRSVPEYNTTSTGEPYVIDEELPAEDLKVRRAKRLVSSGEETKMDLVKFYEMTGNAPENRNECLKKAEDAIEQLRAIDDTKVVEHKRVILKYEHLGWAALIAARINDRKRTEYLKLAESSFLIAIKKMENSNELKKWGQITGDLDRTKWLLCICHAIHGLEINDGDAKLSTNTEVVTQSLSNIDTLLTTINDSYKNNEFLKIEKYFKRFLFEAQKVMPQHAIFKQISLSQNIQSKKDSASIQGGISGDPKPSEGSDDLPRVAGEPSGGGGQNDKPRPNDRSTPTLKSSQGLAGEPSDENGQNDKKRIVDLQESSGNSQKFVSEPGNGNRRDDIHSSNVTLQRSFSAFKIEGEPTGGDGHNDSPNNKSNQTSAEASQKVAGEPKAGGGRDDIRKNFFNRRTSDEVSTIILESHVKGVVGEEEYVGAQQYGAGADSITFARASQLLFPKKIGYVLSPIHIERATQVSLLPPGDPRGGKGKDD